MSWDLGAGDALAWLFELARAVALLMVLAGALVGVEYARYRRARARWLAAHPGIVGRRGRVVANRDGVSLLEDGTEIPAVRVGEAWRYRHAVGATVEVLGFPGFGALLAAPPVTVEVG